MPYCGSTGGSLNKIPAPGPGPGGALRPYPQAAVSTRPHPQGGWTCGVTGHTELGRRPPTRRGAGLFQGGRGYKAGLQAHGSHAPPGLRSRSHPLRCRPQLAALLASPRVLGEGGEGARGTHSAWQTACFPPLSATLRRCVLLAGFSRVVPRQQRPHSALPPCADGTQRPRDGPSRQGLRVGAGDGPAAQSKVTQVLPHLSSAPRLPPARCRRGPSSRSRPEVSPPALKPPWCFLPSARLPSPRWPRGNSQPHGPPGPHLRRQPPACDAPCGGAHPPVPGVLPAPAAHGTALHGPPSPRACSLPEPTPLVSCPHRPPWPHLQAGPVPGPAPQTRPTAASLVPRAQQPAVATPWGAPRSGRRMALACPPPRLLPPRDQGPGPWATLLLTRQPLLPGARWPGLLIVRHPNSNTPHAAQARR